ncbi:MAG: TonB family protein [Thiobacillus sp.]|nr:TonB family protein [Thiobacillus sp.]
MIAAPRHQHFSSGSLALVVHGLFALALVVSMSWKNLPHLPVEADLWSTLPEPLTAEPEPVPLDSESLPRPEPASPPVAEPQPREADIALKKAEQEKKRQAEEELRKQEESRKLEEKRQAEEKTRREQEEFAEMERIEQIRQKEQRRRQMEEELVRQAQADLEREETQMRVLQEQAVRAERRDRLVEDFKRRIQSKVQSYVRLPQRIAGNPEAVFQVSLFANGEIRNVTLVKSSGHAAYDVEVERAILKASPLPLPNEKEAASVFRGGLVLKFRPFDGSPGAGLR